MNEALWTPSPERVIQTNMAAFLRYVADRGGPYIADYSPAAYWQIYEWSLANPEKLWAFVWRFCDVVGHRGTGGGAERVGVGIDRVAPPHPETGPRWFPDASINFAENLLRFTDDAPAISSWNEEGHQRTISYRELREAAGTLALALSSAGVRKGDRVAGFLPNIPEAVIAMIATTSLGAIWSSCSPDFGPQGVLDRFGQIAPKVLFCADGYLYAGKEINLLARIRQIAFRIPSLEHVVVIPYRNREPSIEGVRRGQIWSRFIATQWGAASSRDESLAQSADDVLPPGLDVNTPSFERMAFDHPIYIMYSSGTTGLPKCMVHGAGGTLLQHLKELVLHSDLKREDRIFYYTTCGWMMWNWLVSSLAVGARIVLYDGAPMSPNPEVLWDMAEREGVTIFGTSARYLASMEKIGMEPAKTHDLSSLKAILSTGSPLAAHSFDYVYRKIKGEVHLASISGGTDIISCFALGNPLAPVYRGQLQTPGLGMAVEVWDEQGRRIKKKPGELVCTKPFASMPVSFWNDADGARYNAAYFETFPNVWRHGDWAEETAERGYVIYGRSDATLNPGGVRIGTAEIYRQVEQLPEVVESVAVGQEINAAGGSGGAAADVRVVLFVKLAGGIVLDEDLSKRIGMAIRENATPLHVPKKIIQVADIPRTISGKISELAVREVIHGRPVKNTEALANPQALELYRNLVELRS